MHRPPTSLWRLLAPIALVVAVLGAPAQARDSWTHLRPGVDWLRRSVPGVVPQQVRAARFDLSRPEVSVHASVDLTHSERTVATSTFGRHIGAIAAINGDVSDGEVPVGLAIGDGAQWHDPPASHAWSYFACDIFNQCTIDTLPPHDGSWAFLPALYPYRYYNAVGGEAELLLRDGVRGPECDCPTCRDARSAVGLDETGTILWFVVVEAGHAGASGMTCGELRDLLEELGVHDAMMLAGGPNSALWVDGILRNYPTEGREAVQANHLAVMYTPTADPQCTVRSRRWCEESIVRTCTGGRLVGERVCADSEAGCGSDGDWAFCVDPRCPADDGLGTGCIDDDHAVSCTDGVYTERDCTGAGLVCGTDDAGSACMDVRCARGPHTSLCIDSSELARCVDGAYERSACADGTSCEEGPTDAACVGPEPEPAPDAGPGSDVEPGPDAGTATDAGADPGDSEAGDPVDADSDPVDATLDADGGDADAVVEDPRDSIPTDSTPTDAAAADRSSPPTEVDETPTDPAGAPADTEPGTNTRRRNRACTATSGGRPHPGQVAAWLVIFAWRRRRTSK